jgi:hypothetical protein
MLRRSQHADAAQSRPTDGWSRMSDVVPTLRDKHAWHGSTDVRLAEYTALREEIQNRSGLQQTWSD